MGVFNDETMVGFRGRFSAKQYMPNNPEKWGIKAFTMADSTNGYMLNILVYTGAGTLDQSTTDQALPQPVRIVMHLVEPYLDLGHHIFTDRYYTSIPLVLALEARLTSFTGTCMRNRLDLPDDIRYMQRLPDDGTIAFRAGRHLCMAWRAPQKIIPFVMVSSDSSAKMITVPSRNSYRQTLLKPQAVDLYNHNMNGVDVADQLTVFTSARKRAG